MLEELNSFGEQLVLANNTQADTQKLFDDNRIVDALNKLNSKFQNLTPKQQQSINNTLKQQ
jgi:hypothetical protein